MKSLIDEFQTSPNATIIIDARDGRIRAVNDAFVELAGLAPADVIGRLALALGAWLDPSHYGNWQSSFDRQGEFPDIELLIYTRSGEPRLVKVSTTMQQANADVFAVATLKLIEDTGTRTARATASADGARFRALIERVPIVVYAEDAGSLAFTYVSPHIEHLLGYAPIELISRPGLYDSRIHPNDLASVRRRRRESHETGEQFRHDYRVQARDGSWRHVRDEAAPALEGSSGLVQRQGALLDLTELRGAEEALRIAEARYHDLFDNAPVMYVVTRVEGGIPVVDDCNRLFCDTLDYAFDEVVGRPFGEFYSPDSREAMLGGGYAAALNDQLPPVERQLLTRDGHIVDVLALSRAELGADGQPRGTRVGFIDISARKAAEAARHEALRRAKTLLETSLDGIIATDREGAVLDFNPAAERILGFQRNDVLGKSIAELVVPPELREEFSRGLNSPDGTDQGLPLGERFETTAIRADGSRVPVELTVNRIDGAGGPVFVGYVRDISSRTAMEAALLASEARFRSLVQNSYDVITVVNRDGAREYVSPSIERVLGHEAASLLGADALSLVHPDDKAAFTAEMQRVLAGAPQTRVLELRFRHADGSWRTFETVGTNLLNEPGVGGIVFNSRDVTRRIQTEAALRESEERFRSAFDNAPIGLALVQEDDRFREVNRSLCDLIGYEESELLKRTIADLTFEEDVADSQELANRLWSGAIDRYEVEKRLVHGDGRIVWVDLTASAVRNDEGQRVAIVQIEDITARRRLDIDRATMLASERAYTKQLRDLADMRSDLSRMVSHELRAPVAALRMMTSMLATGDLAPEARAETLEAIQNQIAQLDRLTSDVAAMATSERDDFSVQLHAVPISILLTGAAAYAKSAIGDRPVVVTPESGIRVWCDPDRINQVLRNLLDNVARHTPAGAPVEIRATLHGDLVRIEVSDHGPGIAEDDLPLIFEKFGRGRDASSAQRSGAGLGLYLSRQIVQAHGSELTARSGPDGGAVFGFDLRVAP